MGRIFSPMPTKKTASKSEEKTARKSRVELTKIGAVNIRGNAAALCAHLEIDRTRLSDLQGRGILPMAEEDGGYDFDGCRRAYIRHIRDVASGRGGSAGEKLSEERARQARAGADAQEMKNAVRRGELLEVSRVVDEYAADLEGLRGAILNIPGQIGQECATMTPAEIAQRVAELIDDAFVGMRAADEVVAKVQGEQMGDAEGQA